MTPHTTPTPTQVDAPGTPHNPAFAQGVIAPAGPTLHVGGQNGIDASGRVLDGVEAQTVQALHNLLAVLDAAGTGPEHVVKLTIHLVQGVDVRAAFAASQQVWHGHRTAVTVLLVAGLVVPGALVEIDAVASVPS